MTYEREADARAELGDFPGSAPAITKPAPIVYRDTATGKEIDPGDVLWYKDLTDNKVKKKVTAPLLSPEEQTQAANTLREMLDTGQVNYPNLARHLLANPEKLWLAAEIQLMLSPTPNEVSYDVTSELMEALTTTEGQKTEYEYRTSHEGTQQLFWNEVGTLYGMEERDFFISSLAQLTAHGANKVAAKAIAWSDTRDMEDEENQAQLFLNMATWTSEEQEYELGGKGFFGAIEALQEGLKEQVFEPGLNFVMGVVKGPEEAARRKDLTWGQQIAVMFGAPVNNPGEFGWWNFISGAADAQIEIGGDPLNWAAGVGAASKALRVIPVAQRATRAGRAAAALRSLLPKPLAGQARNVAGGRIARFTHALGARTIDDLLERTVQSGVAQDALDLVKAGNMGRFQRLYPAWKGISDEAQRVIAEAVESPEEFIEVLKADALNSVLAGGRQIDDLTAAAKNSSDTLFSYVNEPDAPLAAEINRWKTRFAYHTTTRAEAQKILHGSLKAGGLYSKLDDAIGFVRHPSQATDRVVLVFRKKDLPPSILNPLKKNGQIGDIRGLPGVKPVAMFDAAKGSESGIQVAGKGKNIVNVGPRSFHDLLVDPSIPRDVRMQAVKDHLTLRTFNMQNERYWIMSEVPQRSKRVFSWQNVLDRSTSTGRLATGVRRTVARITPGRIPSEIHLFDSRQGVDDLRRLGEHFGLRQQAIDDLVVEFEGLELGARQDWVWDRFLRTIGRETGVPAFEHQLVQFYKGGGVRNFSASGVDLIGEGKRIPMIPAQMTATMPVPTEVLTQVFARARSIGHRPKLARAIGFNGRGLGGTKSRRQGLVNQIRAELGDDAEGMSDEQLYNMAYSLVSPNGNMDGRGLFVGGMMPKAGSAFGNLHDWFTKSMLVFRPFQWMWRVAILEEPIRAHIYNLPSLYSNPLGYMSRMREAHYIANVRQWAEANMSWGQDIMAVLSKGNRSQMLANVKGYGLTDEIFGGKIPRSTQNVRRGIEKYVESAMYGRTRPNRLNPIRRVPWAVKNRARSIARAEKMMKDLNLPTSFDFHEAASPIAGRLVSGYLGEAVGATHRKLYQWGQGMTNDEAFTHGRVWGGNLIQFVEDSFGRSALRRRAALLRNASPDVNGDTLINSGAWSLMAPDLRLKYPGLDDVQVAERYMDDMLATEIDYLFAPFKSQLSRGEYADLLDEFADSRRITANINGQAVDWDLRSANYGAGVRQVGDFAASVRQTNTAVPTNLPAISFDGRFLAEDDRGFFKRASDWTLQTFGENATQVLNRRPAWISTYNRWYTHYEKLGLTPGYAERLATDHANKMVNYIFFNMDEAPYYIARLNKYLPFFGSVYEVTAAWTYKMPVAVGGSWPLGAGEFARKFDRLIDGMVNIGLLSREEEENGDITLTLNFVPPESDYRSDNVLGSALQGAGYAIINTLDQAVSTILGMEEGLGLRSQGYRVAAGHPLNPNDYGVLSFWNADVGLNPITNIAVSTLAAAIPGATGPRQSVAEAGESIADAAERLGVSTDDLIRYNREVFIDTEGFGSTDLYNSLLSGNVSPEDIVLPDRAILNLPGSSLWDAFSDTFMPFGEVTSPHEFAVNFIPGTLRWVLAGLALQNQPTDEFWSEGTFGGFGGVLPRVNQAQMASQVNEAFMYLEAHDLIDGKGPFTRIMEKEKEIERLLNEGNAEAANALRAEVNLDTEAFLNRAQKVAAESLIMRGLTGQMLPTSPGHVRLEEQRIRDYWDTREYADSIKAGEGVVRLRNFKTMEEYEDYKEQLAAWLADPTGDRARATFRANNPQLMAYLTPKTFYKEPVPDISSFEEYQRQVESGERQSAPLHVTMWRARSAAIQADYYNKFIAEFGNDPYEAAATALQNRTRYNELTEEKDLEYQTLEMWDDMHGSVYDNWRTENYQDVETWAQDQINDKLNDVRDNLEILFELEDYMDIELDLEGIAGLNQSIRGAIAEISGALREYNALTADAPRRNVYEQAIHEYFEQVYIPYAESISALYDRLPEVADSERESLIYEQIKFIKNQHANSMVFLGGNTSVPFPNPLEFSWQGKSDEEKMVKTQQWLTRPLEWMDLDQATRIIESAPHMQGFLPADDAAFDIYREYTLKKIEVDEMFEANEITRSQRNKAIENMDKKMRQYLIEQGRGNEVLMMNMTPYEKLELAGMLPYAVENLPVGNGILGDAVRWYREALEAAEESAGTVIGRQMTAPLYDVVEAAFYSDPAMREALQDLGINLQDDTAMDSFLPWLFFNYTGER